MTKKSKEIREEIGRQFDRAQAIADVAAEAKRDLSDEEKTIVDGILGSGKRGEQGYKPGAIDKLEADAERWEKIEARADSLATVRNAKPAPGFQADESEPDADDPHPTLAKVKIPATARFSHGGLQAFRPALFNGSSDKAEKAAYATGQFILATIGQSDTARKWCKDHGVDVRFRGALKESSDTLGGYLVPSEMERSIIVLREERGVMRHEAQVIPMSSETYDLPRQTGGLTAYFVGESVAGTESTSTLDRPMLSAKKLMAYTTMSSEVSEDAVISLADMVARDIAYAMADKEDLCGFIGDSSNTYGGMTGLQYALAAGSVVTATGHATFDALTLADFHNMKAKLPQYAERNAKWYISKAGFAASMERLMSAGGGNTYVTLANGSSMPRFLGYDVVFVQVMNSTLSSTTGQTGVCFLGDVRQGVKLGSRRGLAIDSSKDFLFTSDAIAIKGTERFDIVVTETGTSTVAGSVISLTFG